MGITKHITHAKKNFEIYGILEDNWELFRKNVDYEGFLVMRKKH